MDQIINIEIYNEGFNISYQICLLYEKLKYIKEEDSESIFILIEKLISIENKIYGRLSMDEVKKYQQSIDIIDNIPIKRYINKLYTREINILNTTNNKYDYLKINSYIEAIINIDTLSLLYKKLTSFKTSKISSQDQKFLKELFNCFNQMKFDYLNTFKLSEDYSLPKRYNFNKISPINMGSIPEIAYNNYLFIPYANFAIKYIIENHDKPKNPVNILNNLYYISVLEIILSIVDYNSLREIVNYCNSELTNPSSYQLEAGSIRRLLYKRKNELENNL